MIKLIIFDLDGVLVSTKDIHYNSLNKSLSNIDKKFEILAFHKSQSDKPYMNKQSIKDFHNFYFPSSLQGIYYESLYIEKLLS